MAVRSGKPPYIVRLLNTALVRNTVFNVIKCRCSRHINLQIRWHSKISQAKGNIACMFHPRVVFSVLARCRFLLAVVTAATISEPRESREISAAILSKPSNQLNVFEIINSHSLTLLLVLRLLTPRTSIH